MHVDLSAAGTMPSSEKHATLATLVLNILSATDQVRDAAKAEADADTEGPGAGVKMSACILKDFRCWEESHWVVLPVTKLVVVMARVPQAGQSTGAGERFRLAMAVALRNCCPPEGC